VPTSRPFILYSLMRCLVIVCALGPQSALAQTGSTATSPTMPAALQAALAADEELRNLRRRMIAGDELSDRALQRLADNADGLAAFRYARRLEARNDPQVRNDAAHYYAIACYTGRAFAVRPLAALISSRDVELSLGHQKSALDALTVQARNGNADAALALGSMYQDGWPFGVDLEESQRWLLQAAQLGSDDAAFKLLLANMLAGDNGPADITAANDALDILAASDDPGKIAMAATLRARLLQPPQPATAPMDTEQKEAAP
jgi:TPR repeat protein